jgi:hypothetical protein
MFLKICTDHFIDPETPILHGEKKTPVIKNVAFPLWMKINSLQTLKPRKTFNSHRNTLEKQEQACW